MDQNHEKEFTERTGVRFSEFYQATYSKLVTYITKYTKDKWKAQDIAQDAYLQALLRISTYRTVSEGGASLTTWLFRIAFHIWWKTKKRMKNICQESMDTYTEKQMHSLRISMEGLDGANRDSDIEIEQKAKIIIETIASLPNKDYKIKRSLELREIHRLPYQQIANESKQNLSTVKSQIRKGREIVRKKVALKLALIE